MVLPFQTPPNEQSFSSLIDEAILATGKPGSLINAVQYARLTVRECQSFGLFARDLVEDQVLIAADDDIPFTWDRPTNFRRIRTVKYTNACYYPKLRLPGKIQHGEDRYFYAADDYFVFAGAGAGETLGLAYYKWLKGLSYYAQLGAITTQFPGGPYAIRPAYYDTNEEEWYYLNADETAYVTTLGDAAEELARRLLTTNWLVTEWRDLILSGIKAKIWNNTGDPRGAVEYSAYKQTQTLLRNTVGYEAEGF
jgi:hypothetical protein